MFKLLARGLGVVAITAPVLATVVAGPASAQTSTAQGGSPGQSPALVGPLLDFFMFGDTIGAPLVCGVAAAGVGDGAAQYGFAQQSASLVNAINQGCGTVSAEGAQYIQMAQVSDTPLAALNPYANPAIQSTGTSVTEGADTLGPAINPFGPTVAGLGATIEWFEGR